jgi:Flp pilus assembly protein TadB
MRGNGDEYVKVTVFLATVLLLTALTQQFAMVGPRVAVVAVAFVMLLVSMYWIWTFPRAKLRATLLGDAFTHELLAVKNCIHCG